MSRICPLNHSIVLYLDCLDCDYKICKQLNSNKNNKKGLQNNEKSKNKRK